MNGGKAGNERRKWTRLPLAIPVFVRSRDGKGKEFLEFATALNVSAGGMLVAIRSVSARHCPDSAGDSKRPRGSLALLPRGLANPSRQSTSHHASRRLLLAGPQVCATAAGSPAYPRRRKIASAV